MHWIILTPVMLALSAAPPNSVSVHVRGSLSLRQGTYSSLIFVAEPQRMPDNNLPIQYRFTESGETPPGMRFETYPCNKPDQKVCPEVASANGIYLDGTPAKAGSYTFTITASDRSGEVSQPFTVVVNPADSDK